MREEGNGSRFSCKCMCVPVFVNICMVLACVCVYVLVTMPVGMRVCAWCMCVCLCLCIYVAGGKFRVVVNRPGLGSCPGLYRKGYDEPVALGPSVQQSGEWDSLQEGQEAGSLPDRQGILASSALQIEVARCLLEPVGTGCCGDICSGR